MPQPSITSLHQDMLDLRERVTMADALLRGDDGYAGVISDLRAVTSMVQEMREADRDREREKKAVKSQLFLAVVGTALSALFAGVSAWIAWVVGHK